MKKRLMSGLAAGVLAAAMLPGVASAQGLVEYDLLCRGGVASNAAKEPNLNLADLLGPIRAEYGKNFWGQLMRTVNQVGGFCQVAKDEPNPLP